MNQLANILPTVCWAEVVKFSRFSCIILLAKHRISSVDSWWTDWSWTNGLQCHFSASREIEVMQMHCTDQYGPPHWCITASPVHYSTWVTILVQVTNANSPFALDFLCPRRGSSISRACPDHQHDWSDSVWRAPLRYNHCFSCGFSFWSTQTCVQVSSCYHIGCLREKHTGAGHGAWLGHSKTQLSQNDSIADNPGVSLDKWPQVEFVYKSPQSLQY